MRRRYFSRTSIFIMPERIQFKRRKGFRLPANTVRVLRPSYWGNEYKIGMVAFDGETEKVIHLERRQNVIAAHERQLKRILERDPKYLEPLRGKNLACFCRLDQECHADVLLKYANR